MNSQVRHFAADPSIGVAGCYYPAKIQPPAQAKTQTVVKVPYDLTWDAVHRVIARMTTKSSATIPNHGIVEAEAHSFTLADADCGQMKSVAQPIRRRAARGSSAVYNFKVEPAGPQATSCQRQRDLQHAAPCAVPSAYRFSMRLARHAGGAPAQGRSRPPRQANAVRPRSDVRSGASEGIPAGPPHPDARNSPIRSFIKF